MEGGRESTMISDSVDVNRKTRSKTRSMWYLSVLELTRDLRRKYRVEGFTNLSEMFANHPLEDTISLIYDVMKVFV